jgi:homoserine kinase
MGNVGGLIAGLYTQDYDLIGRSLHDEIVEPALCADTWFWSNQKTAMENGAWVLEYQDLGLLFSL